MYLFEFADTIKKSIVLRRFSNQSGRWICMFDHSLIKDGGLLIAEYGNGSTPDEAINEYMENIRGKVIVFDAYDNENRQEYYVPKTLE
jgi:hypothetical protein